MTAFSKGRYNEAFLSGAAYSEESSLVFVVILSCLFPLAVYCLFLASLNRRPHPMVLPGAWDFAGVLLGASGFLIVAGPFVLSAANDRSSEYWLYSSAPRIVSLSRHGWYLQMAVWLGYFILVLVGCALLLRKRRRITSIYNVQPTDLLEAVSETLERLGLESRRAGNRIVISDRKAIAVAAGQASLEQNEDLSRPPMNTPSQAGNGGAGGGPCVMEIDVFPVLRHGTLHWPARSTELRTQFETELCEVLGERGSEPNPAANWFFALALLLFVIGFSILIGFVLLNVLYWLKMR